MTGSTSDLLLFLGGLLGLLAVAFGPLIVFGARHERHKRELDHAARMRALELGQAWPPRREASATPVLIAVALGVPVAVSLCAWAASLTTAFGKEAWTTASIVGLGGVICGSVLTMAVLGYNMDKAESAAKKAPKKPDADEWHA